MEKRMPVEQRLVALPYQIIDLRIGMVGMDALQEGGAENGITQKCGLNDQHALHHTATSNSRKALFSEVLRSVLSLRLPMMSAQGT
jgi:hypothetical protein